MRSAHFVLPLAVACGLFAIVTIGCGLLTIVMVRQASPEPEPQASSLLIDDDQKAFANAPISLQVSVVPAPQNELLKFVGLAAGGRVSAAVTIENSAWQLPAHDLNNVSIYPPADFVGTMHVMVALLSQDQKLLALHAVRLQWTAKNLDPLQAGSQINSGYSEAAAVPQTDRGGDAGAQKEDAPGRVNKINLGETNFVAVSRTDHDANTATQNADALRLGTKINLVNTNAVIQSNAEEAARLGGQTNPASVNALAVEPTARGEHAGIQNADAPRLGNQFNSAKTDDIIAPPADHGETAEIQETGAHRFGDQISEGSANAGAEPNEPDNNAAMQKADAALAVIRELNLDGISRKSRRYKLSTRPPQSSPAGRSPNPTPPEFGQARL